MKKGQHTQIIVKRITSDFNKEVLDKHMTYKKVFMI